MTKINKNEDNQSVYEKKNNKASAICKVKNYINLETTQNTIYDFIQSLLLVVMIVVPFVVIKYGQRYYIDAKVTLLYAAAFIIFVAMMFSKRIKIRREIEVALIFLGTICISAIFSSFSSTAIWGSIERREGCVMFFVYIILFIAASSFFSVDKRTINVMLIAASLMSCYTILQMFKIDPLQEYLYGKIVTPDTSIATIGNSNFVSSYLSMLLVIALGLYIYRKKLIYLLYSSIIFLGFLAARTRGGWITFVLVAVVALIFIIKSKEKLIRAGIVFVTFVVLAFSLDVATDGMIYGRAKLSNIFERTNTESSEVTENVQEESNSSNEESSNNENTNDNQDKIEPDNSSLSNEQTNNNEESNSSIKLLGSFSSRANILKITFKAFLDKPLLGEGPDTLGQRLKRDYSSEYYNHAKLYNEGIDKAHNEYLEYATSCSIFTLISYLVLVGMILFKLFKERKNDKKAILFLTILMYLSQAFFNISVIMVAPVFWIIMGYAVKVIYNDDNENCEMLEE